MNRKPINPLHALPFVDMSAPDLDAHFWQLPARGLSYQDGCEAGRWAALSFLRYVKNKSMDDGGTLQLAMLALCHRLAEADAADRDALQGQVVGFMATIEGALRASPYTVAATEAQIAAGLAASVRWAKTRAARPALPVSQN